MTQAASEHLVYHFTHVDHIVDIMRGGLACDSDIQVRGNLIHEAGDQAIKNRRRDQVVPCGPGGTVADYVPFYFAPRSPMLYRITNPNQLPTGGVSTYDGSPDELVYLISSVEHLHEAGLAVVLTDRNAATSYVAFSDNPIRWFAPDFIDWPLMQARYWTDSSDYQDRKERRMAECLVHRNVPWELITGITVHDETLARRLRRVFASVGGRLPALEVEPDWYF